jgi:K+-sensing histidine kinase KdpD
MDIAVLRHIGDNEFELAGDVPRWLSELWPECRGGRALRPQDRFVYLEYFLEEAAEVWGARASKSWISSGPWTEVDGAAEVSLEAIALVHDGHQALMLKLPTADYETVRQILQKSREQDLVFAQLVKETNRRETLLHCVVHDLSSPLSGVSSSLKLLREDALVTGEGERLVEIGLSQTAKMQRSIGQILESFKAHVANISPSVVTSANAPSLLEVAESVAATLAPVGREVQVSFRVTGPQTGLEATRVSADSGPLERVIFNLLDNALRFAPRGTVIDLKVVDDGTSVSCSVIDRGPGVRESDESDLFKRLKQGASRTGAVGLGLYFCKITVADWGGDISYSRAPSGGAAFTFTIPKPAAKNAATMVR